jgi:hypothetical protein
VARTNDYDVRIAHTQGEHLWHVHADTDEFFLVLEGQFPTTSTAPPASRSSRMRHFHEHHLSLA